MLYLPPVLPARDLAFIMELASLPIDVFYLICDCLPQGDLKKVRLLNRTISKLVRLRFTRVFLSPNKTNINAFRGIAKSDDFRSQVREIVWDDARLKFYNRQRLSLHDSAMLGEDLRLGCADTVSQEEKGFEHFEHDVECDEADVDEKEMLARRVELWGANFNEMSLEDCFTVYNDLYDEQQEIIESGEDVETLLLGLTSFPNLERITVSSEAWRFKPLFPKFSTPFFRALPPGFRMPLPWPWLGDDDRETAEDEDPFEKLKLPWDEAHQEWRGYQIVISALLFSYPNHSVRELITDTNFERTGLSHQLFASDQQNVGYATTLQLFATVPLTRLELCLNVHTAEETSFSCFHNGLLRKALSHLSALKHLMLCTSIYHDTMRDIINDNNTDTPWIHIDELIPLEFFQTRLESLHLRNFFLHGKSLLVALEQLKSLSAVHLDSLTLTEEFTWREFWHQAKNELTTRWRPDQPTVTFMYQLFSPHARLDISAELAAFLYGDEECPFAENLPMHATVGMVVNDWEPESRIYWGPIVKRDDSKSRMAQLN